MRAGRPGSSRCLPKVGEMIFSLEGKRIIVTGASRGIGRGLAVAFAERGARVACLGRSQLGLAETLAMVEAHGNGGLAAVGDLTDDAELCSLFDHSVERLGGLDVLVNNAAMGVEESALELDVATLDRVLGTNLRAPLQLAQLAGRTFAAQGHGKIINVGSIGSHVGWSGDLAYLVSKHGLLGMTRALAIEWAAAGVQVNLLSPGFIQTEMTTEVMEDPERNAWVLSNTPVGRWGQVEDIVGAAVLLASAASDFMTGQAIIVDGGWTAQ